MFRFRRTARFVFVVTPHWGGLTVSAEAQIVICERVEVAPPPGVAVPDASLAACGGLLEPPCPPDPPSCEFPDETACVFTDDGFSGVVVTAPGRLSF